MFFVLASSSILFYSCEEDVKPPNAPVIDFVEISDWSPLEKSFFNSGNSANKAKISSRSRVVFDNSVVDLFNQMVRENEMTPFAETVYRSIGVPYWEEAASLINEDGGDMVILPFGYPDTPYTRGFILALREGGETDFVIQHFLKRDFISSSALEVQSDSLSTFQAAVYALYDDIIYGHLDPALLSFTDQYTEIFEIDTSANQINEASSDTYQGAKVSSRNGFGDGQIKIRVCIPIWGNGGSGGGGLDYGGYDPPPPPTLPYIWTPSWRSLRPPLPGGDESGGFYKNGMDFWDNIGKGLRGIGIDFGDLWRRIFNGTSCPICSRTSTTSRGGYGGAIVDWDCTIMYISSDYDGWGSWDEFVSNYPCNHCDIDFVPFDTNCERQLDMIISGGIFHDEMTHEQYYELMPDGCGQCKGSEDETTQFSEYCREKVKENYKEICRYRLELVAERIGVSDSKLNETVDYDDCNCVGDYVAYEECVIN